MDEREKGFECLPAEREKSISRTAFILRRLKLATG